MQLRNAVDGLAVGDAHVGHVRLVISQDGHVADAVPLAREAVKQLLAQAAVELLHDRVDTRQGIAHHGLRPLLQGLGHDGVVGVGNRVDGDLLGDLPRQVLLVHQDAHQLRNDQRRVRIVDVEGNLLRQQIHVGAVDALEVLQGVLQGRGDQEVLLHQAQLLAVVGVVFRIEDLGDLSSDGVAVLGGAVVIAGGELLQVEVLGQHGAPHAQAVDDLVVVAEDRQIIRHSDDVFGILQGDIVLAAHPVFRDAAAETDGHSVALGRNLPGIAVGQPLIRHLDLLAVNDALTEQTVLVADGAAHGRQIQGGERIQEASGKTAQTAVAQSRFRLLVQHAAQGQTQLIESLFVFLGGAEVEQVVVQPAAGQELDGEVVQALGLLLTASFLFKAPLQHDLVTDGGSHGRVDLLRGRFLNRRAVITQQLVEDGLLDGVLVVLVHKRHRFKPSQVFSAAKPSRL